jgi:hypothetical protein
LYTAHALSNFCLEKKKKLSVIFACRYKNLRLPSKTPVAAGIVRSIAQHLASTRVTTLEQPQEWRLKVKAAHCWPSHKRLNKFLSTTIDQMHNFQILATGPEVPEQQAQKEIKLCTL